MKRFITLALCLFVSVATYAQTQVIAHRGYHATKNSYDNTISSLINAQKLKVYGSEVDIHETSDGVLIAIHGMRHRDIKNVQKATFDEIRSLPLENGETVPTLEEYLIQLFSYETLACSGVAGQYAVKSDAGSAGVLQLSGNGSHLAEPLYLRIDVILSIVSAVCVRCRCLHRISALLAEAC